MGWCARLAPALLLYINLLLCVVGGAALATAARLKWDPSTYIVVRALFPAEYRAAAAALTAAGAALPALAHLAAAALFCRNSKLTRALLITYGVCVTGLVCGEVAWAAWTGARLAAWLQSAGAAQLQEALRLREYLRPFLAFLGRWHPLPDHINQLIQEAEADAARNVYVAGAAALAAALLQLAAALLALVCAAARAPARAPARARARAPASAHSSTTSIASTDNEKAPLRTAFRNGKLVVL